MFKSNRFEGKFKVPMYQIPQEIQTAFLYYYISTINSSWEVSRL